MTQTNIAKFRQACDLCSQIPDNVQFSANYPKFPLNLRLADQNELSDALDTLIQDLRTFLYRN